MNKLNAYQLFHAGSLALAKIEQQGFRVDENYLEKTTIRLQRKIKRLEDQFYSTKFYRRWEHSSKGKVNIYSADQLQHYLFKIQNIDSKESTEKGRASDSKDALAQLQIPELNLLIQLREYKQALQTFISGLQKESINGMIHPFFHLHLVRSFRSSSANPNFQNMPKRNPEIMGLIRNAVLPRPGHQIIEFDFSGLEVSIAACYHQDPTMIDYLVKGKDMHSDVAKQIFFIDDQQWDKNKYKLLRQAAKNGFVFPQFYGDYYVGCTNSLMNWVQLRSDRFSNEDGWEMPSGETIAVHLKKNGIRNRKQFEDHIRDIEFHFWNRRFKKYDLWRKKIFEEYQKNGVIQSKTGFEYRGEMSRKDVINYPVQGAAFHCLLWSLIRLDELLDQMKESKGWTTRLIGQIHDSLVLDVNPNEKKDLIAVVKKITETQLRQQWKWITMPLHIGMEEAPVDQTWAKMKEVKI